MPSLWAHFPAKNDAKGFFGKSISLMRTYNECMMGILLCSILHHYRIIYFVTVYSFHRS